MIQIHISPHCITAHGHAQDSAGCAAVSAILYALAGGLDSLGGPACWHIGPGEARLPLPGHAAARIMGRMAEIGLRQIAAVRNDVHISPAEPTL